VARGVRRRAVEHVLRNGGGYLSQACSSAELLATLYGRVMRLGPSAAPMVPPPFTGTPGKGREPISGSAYNGPRRPELDRFFFSPVHYSLVLYATLIEFGRLAPEGLEAFNRDGSTVEMIGAEHSPGIEVTAGSLGQTLSQAGGVALARKLRGEPGRTWVMMSDGELQEGQTWEALAALAFDGLDRVGIYIDVNGQQCDGPMTEVMTIEPAVERIEAFGVTARSVDGHDVDALAAACDGMPDGRPRVVLARTDPCRGLPALRARSPKLHYVRFASEDERQVLVEALRDLQSDDEPCDDEQEAP